MATRPLEDFLRALRDAEVRVSVAETLDAHRVVGLLGFQDRAVTKDALAVTLAPGPGPHPGPHVPGPQGWG